MRHAHHHLVLLLALTAITLSGCKADFGLEDKLFYCTTDEHCAPGYACDQEANTCVPTSGGGIDCIPDCGGKECGSDGCGGSCGECSGTEICGTSGTCECIPSCSGKECGDDGCGGTCGTCLVDAHETWVCVEGGVCECVPQCEGKECGNDSCGGLCGDCQEIGEQFHCTTDSKCVCVPECQDKDCGEDGCGGTCGECETYEYCSDAFECACEPDCDDKECGDDGCGSTCGTCDLGDVCTDESVCECEPQCDGKTCGDDGCGSTCGTCPPSWECSADGVCLWLGDTAKIQGGTFTMGAQSENAGFAGYDPEAEDNEAPTHKVSLSTYYIMNTEVTVGMYEECVDEGACSLANFKAYVADDYPGCSYNNPGTNDEFPMNCITWSGAKEFCQWVGGDLPTEGQWEFAARGMTSTKYPWGNSPEPSCALVIMYDTQLGCGQGSAWPVGSKPDGATPELLYDMAGNVWEWTNDWYEDYTDDSLTNPKGPCDGDTECPGYIKRVIKGGSYLGYGTMMRSSYRNAQAPIFWDTDLGFRCVF